MRSCRRVEKLRELSILVVGGAGYVGTRLVSRLIEEGHRVVVVDTLWFGNFIEGANVIKMDMFEIEPSFLQAFDQVIVLAGLSNDPMADFAPAFNFIENAAAIGYLAYISRQAGIRRLIYAESCAVYGLSEGSASETMLTAPATAYGISKLLGGIAASLVGDATLSIIRLRMGTVCGYSPRMRFDLLLNAMYKTAATEGIVHVNNGRIWRPLLVIDDAVEAYVRAVYSDDDVNGVFNISSGNFTVAAVAGHVQSHFKRHHDRNIEIAERNIPEGRSYKVSVKKAGIHLGYRPSQSIHSCLAELDQNIGLDFDFNNENYYNIRIFRKIIYRRSEQRSSNPDLPALAIH
jgi:nucleoside-diphosphate-sugar epimerase